MKQSDATRNAALLILLVVVLAILIAVFKHKDMMVKHPVRKPVVAYQGS